MLEYYGASFMIDKIYDDPDVRGVRLMGKVSGLTRRWARERFAKPVQDDFVGELMDKNEAILQVRTDTFKEVGYFDLTLEHPDSSEPSCRWRTEFRYATKGAGIDVNVEVSRIGDEPARSQISGMASRPKILEDIFELFECRFGDDELTKQATLLTTEDAEAFVTDVIFNPHRRMPVIAVTKNWHRNIFVNPDRLQSRLLGLASVYYYEDETAQVVNERLGDALSCFGGSVRIYRPGCSIDDIPLQNRFWKGMDIWRMGWEKLLQDVRDECLLRSAIQANSSTYREVRDIIHQNRLDDLRASENLLDSFGEMEANYADLNTKFRELEDENRRLKRANKELELARRFVHTDVSSLELVNDDVLPDFTSVEDAVRHAQRTLGGLMFLESALNSAMSSQFRRPNDVYRIFEALDKCASELEKNGGELGMSIKQWLKDNHGIDYVPDESPTTMGNYGQQRRFTHEGCTVEMQSHIRLGGGGNDHQRQMRIHLIWSNSRKRWLIGHVGKHLDTWTG